MALRFCCTPVVVTWRQLIDPWGDPIYHLFIVGVPVLGGFPAPFLLRHWDLGMFNQAKA